MFEVTIFSHFNKNIIMYEEHNLENKINTNNKMEACNLLVTPQLNQKNCC